MDRRLTENSAFIALDVDLHRIHCWCSECGLVCKNAPNLDLVLAHLPHHRGSRSAPYLGRIATVVFDRYTILFEIASPMAYRDGKAAHYNLAKWMIFNSVTAAQLAPSAERMLVSPSSKWTLGYEVEARHKMAKATASTKDLRECQAMIAFYRMDPAQWVPFADYLKEL